MGNSGYYAGGEDEGGMDNMTRTFMIADIAIAAISLAILALVFARWSKKKKAAKNKKP